MQRDAHFLSVCRYVERNALRANLAPKAEDWRWSSMHVRKNGLGELKGLLADWPVLRPKSWEAIVNKPQDEMELAALRRSATRGRPYGNDRWTIATAKRLGIESALREVGRPRKSKHAKGRKDRQPAGQ